MVRALLCAVAMGSVAMAQPCQIGWSPAFPGGDFDGAIRASTVYNDGKGLALYIGGSFQRAGGVTAGGVAKWTGTSWVPVGGTFDGEVHALHVHTDGFLYAAGKFVGVGGVAARQVARWTGTTWAALPGQQMMGTVKALASATDTIGQSRLWAAGQFLYLPASGNGFAAQWNGSGWVFPGNSAGTSMEVASLAVFPENGQERLFAGGLDRTFPLTGNVRRWVGNAWEDVGNPGVVGKVNAIGTFFDGFGPALFAAGEITAAGAVAANRIAKWNGQAWSALGSGLDNTIHSLALFDPDAQGPLPLGIMAAGSAFNASGNPTSPIWYWNGSSWSARATGMNDSVFTMRPFGSFSLFTGGSFSLAGQVTASRAAYLDAAGFHAMDNGEVGNSPSDAVRCFAWFDDDGPGPQPSKLYVGGSFERVGSINARYLATWNGSSWSSLNASINGPVSAFQVFDDGTGPALYVGGSFTQIAGTPVDRVAKWDGGSWSPVGQGLNGTVLEFEIFAAPSQSPQLWACGYFSSPTGGSTNGVAYWNGTTWIGMSSGGWVNGMSALKSFNVPQGPRLYMADADTLAPSVYEWNGLTLSPVSSGLGFSSYVEALEVFDDGTGPALFAAGTSLATDISSLDSMAKFNGTSWSIVPGGPAYYLLSLAVHDDGRGPALYVGGNFLQMVTGQPASSLARWDGTSWSTFGTLAPSSTSSVLAMTSIDPDGPGPATAALYIGGGFTSIGGVSSANIAVLHSCDCYVNCDGSTTSPSLTANDFICFLNAFAAGSAYANCDGSTGVPPLTAADFQCFLDAYASGCQ